MSISSFCKAHISLRSSDSLPSSRMASLKSGPIAGGDIGRITTELSKLKQIIQEQIRSEDSNWGHLNKYLAALRKEFTDAKEAGEDFIDSTKMHFKDQSNTNGDFGNRPSTLEIKVKRFTCSKVPTKNDDED